MMQKFTVGRTDKGWLLLDLILAMFVLSILIPVTHTLLTTAISRIGVAHEQIKEIINTANALALRLLGN